MAPCDDLADLKAAHEQYLKAVNTLDADGFLAMLHDESAGYRRNRPFSVRKPTAEGIKNLWARYEHRTRTMINPQYRVVGDTGIVWGHRRSVVKVKDGPEETVYSRFTCTWVKSGGKWLRLSFHNSAIPSGE